VISYRVILDVPFQLALFMSELLAEHRREIGVVWQAPIRRRRRAAAAMTVCPGTGLLSQMIERGRWPAHAARASLPGAW
jgi:hypothetical protein